MGGASTVWRARHAAAVVSPTPDEAKVLELVTVAERWAEVAHDDYLASEQVAAPLISAARFALNYELGRLDASTLDARLVTATVHAGLDPDQV